MPTTVPPSPGAAPPGDAAFIRTMSGFYAALLRRLADRLGIPALLAGGPVPAGRLAEATGTHPPSLRRALRGMVCAGLLDEPGAGEYALAAAPAGAVGGPGRGGGADTRGRTPGAGTGALGAMPGGAGEPGRAAGRTDSGPDPGTGRADSGPDRGAGAPGAGERDPLRRVRASGHAFEKVFGLDGLLYSVRTGRPAFAHALGEDAFSYFAGRPEIAGDLHAVTSDVTRRDAPAIVAAHDFTRYGTIVDLGGGNGTLLAAMLRAAPAARGIVVDTPSGAAQARPRLAADPALSGRWDVVAGDFFAGVPAGADLYVLKSVLHDWDDARCRALLARCRAALSPGGAVLVVEPVLPPRAVRSELLWRTVISDLTCLLMTEGGRERTAVEFGELLASADLRIREIVHADSPSHFSLITANPA